MSEERKEIRLTPEAFAAWREAHPWVPEPKQLREPVETLVNAWEWADKLAAIASLYPSEETAPYGRPCLADTTRTAIEGALACIELSLEAVAQKSIESADPEECLRFARAFEGYLMVAAYRDAGFDNTSGMPDELRETIADATASIGPNLGPRLAAQLGRAFGKRIAGSDEVVPQVDRHYLTSRSWGDPERNSATVDIADHPANAAVLGIIRDAWREAEPLIAAAAKYEAGENGPPMKPELRWLAFILREFLDSANSLAVDDSNEEAVSALENAEAVAFLLAFAFEGWDDFPAEVAAAAKAMHVLWMLPSGPRLPSRRVQREIGRPQAGQGGGDTDYVEWRNSLAQRLLTEVTIKAGTLEEAISIASDLGHMAADKIRGGDDPQVSGETFGFISGLLVKWYDLFERLPSVFERCIDASVRECRETPGEGGAA